MSQATDVQMQAFADQRIRRRAEQFRALLAAMRDDKAAIESVFDRAANGAAWADARADGPAKLLASQDVLVFNSFVTKFVQCFDGVALTADVAEMKANLAVFQSACVQAL